MTSLQYSQINPATNNCSEIGGGKSISRISANSSSMFLKNLKGKSSSVNTSFLKKKKKSQKPNTARHRSKSSVFNRLYQNAATRENISKTYLKDIRIKKQTTAVLS